MALDFNTDPYNDDYDEDKKFYKILYRPSYPVQARELTQMQTILQKQIERHGSAVFKQGAMVIPGQMSIYTQVDYVKLQNSYSGVAVDSYINLFADQIVTGSSGLTAKVFYVSPATLTDPHILYLVYTNSASAGEKVFADGEVITSGNGHSAQLAASASTGQGSFASIQRGVYYVDGQFILVEPQTIPLDKFGTTPSYRVGLSVSEKIVTPEDDDTLLDNAQGSYNYAAPGAHRHFIELVLDKRDLSSTTDSGFLALSVVENGTISRDTRVTEYSELEKTLARRTNDEAGSFTVKNFEIDVREFRDNNRGAWTTSTPYINGDVVTSNGRTYTCITQGISAVAPSTALVGGIDTDGSITWEYTPVPNYNRGVYPALASQTTLAAHLADAAKLAVGLEAGKAYVEGYEIEKIAIEYLPISKARTTNPLTVTNFAVPGNIGNYVVVNSSSNIPAIYSQVQLYDRFAGTAGSVPAGGTVIGTAFVHGIEYDSGTTQKVFLFGIKMNSGYQFNRNVKSLYNAAANFTANIQPVLTTLSGSISVSTTAVTGVGTSFLTELAAGDIIYVPGTGVYLQIASVASQTSATLTASATTLTGQAYQLVETQIVDPLNVDALYPLPYYALNSVANVQYTVYENLPNATSDGSGNATFTYTGTGTLTPYTVVNYLIAANNAIVSPTTATVSGNQLILTGVPVTQTIYAVAAVQYTGSLGTTEKVKTLTTQQTSFTTAAAGANVIILDKADGYKLARVEMDTTVAFGGSPTWASTVDVTDRYEFYDGQTESYYGPAYIKLKDTYAPATNPIRVTYQYFSHGTGHYFSLNSYATVGYASIPSYNDVELRDALDFRPRTDDGVTITGTKPVKNGINMFVDMTYYQGRKDVISMGTDGAFIVSKGQSDDVPTEPKAPPNTITLYGLELQPYTFNTTPAQVDISRTDNRRYTMRDIGALEKRIEQLEYYTTLSMLEQETKNTALPDSDGIDRFKTGFVVDNFKGAGIGETTSVDWVCSTDSTTGELRPYFVQQQIPLMEYATSAASRASNGYAMWGDVMTMALDPTTPYVSLVKQDYGTRTENVNPFAVFTFLGEMTLAPATDDWFEVSKNVHVTQNPEGHHSHPKSHRATQGVLGTHWNGWKHHWHGEKIQSSQATKPATKNPHRNHNPSDKHNNQHEHNKRNHHEFTHDQTNHLNYHHQEDNKKTHSIQHRKDVVANIKGNARHKIHHHKTPGTKTHIEDDKIVSTDIIPYIRSRTVLVQAKGLKPNTRFHAFFDGVNVDAYCESAKKLTYTHSNTKEFDHTTPVGSDRADERRKIKHNSQVHLNKGDIIIGGTTAATAIAVGHHIKHDGTRILHVHNHKGKSYQVGENIQGTIPDNTLTVAQGVIVSIEEPSTLTTDEAGNINFTFTIPNTESLRFRTGQREFLLIDALVDNVDNVSSRAHAFYIAKGIIETVDKTTIISVRGRKHSTRNINDSRTEITTIDNTRTTAVRDRTHIESIDPADYPKDKHQKRPRDPLAQTFFVQNPGGALIHHIDIFFASKDDSIPITLELREVVNGYPGETVIPFSQVTLDPSDVNISSSTVLFNGAQVNKWDTPTSFVFEAPVYLKDSEQYAIVLLAETQGYNVWISQTGETMPGSQRTVSKQPNLGSLFKSQNASTWTADQSQDLMFTIWRAKFDIGTSSSPTQALARYVNDDLPYVDLDLNPFEVRSGSGAVRVHHKYHQLVSTSNFSILPSFSDTGLTITTSTSSTAFSSSSNLAAAGIAVGTTIYDSNETLIGTVATIGTTTGTFSANGAVALTAGSFLYVNQTIPGIANTDIYGTHTSISGIDADWFCAEYKWFFHCYWILRRNRCPL
jgi:hypothetical protein